MSGEGPAPQVWPQIEATSLTQVASHAVSQQYESCAQMFAAHESQLEVRLTPVVQMSCVHPPLHDCPQIEATSSTQIELHAVLQQ
jgi:hypothetical protein